MSTTPQKTHADFMRLAIALSRENMQDNMGGPFGAVIVKDGDIIGQGANKVTSSNDPTAHAEVVAIRNACANMDDFNLKGSTIYTSCEPCPMCLSAIYWARIDKIFYANTQHDAAAIDFDDQFLYEEIARDKSQRDIPCEHILHDEALSVFQAWKDKTDKTPY